MLQRPTILTSTPGLCGGSPSPRKSDAGRHERMANAQTIRWWLAAGAAALGPLVPALVPGSTAGAAVRATQTFSTPGVQAPFVVPAGVCGYTVDAFGAQGGAGTNDALGAAGAG